jgi:hypothetical protein
MYTPQMVPVSSNGQVPLVGFSPYQMYATPSSRPPLPILQTTPSCSSVASDSTTHTGEGQASSPPTPLYPQTNFQPVQMVAQPPMMQQPLIPVIQVQTPNGPQFQPLYYVPDQPFQSPIQFGKHFLAPEQHPLMQQTESQKSKGSRSGSWSGDGRSASFSRDGSEMSDSGDKYYPLSLQQTSSLRRTSSDASRDGYGSDCSNSWRGSEYTLHSDEDPSKVHHSESAKMFYPTQPRKMNPHGEKGRSSPPQYAPKYTNEQKSPHNLTPEHNKGYPPAYHNSSDSRASKKRPTSKERQEELYKTELCNYWINGTKCRFGKRCIFAHGQHELRMPKRKAERNRLRPPFHKQMETILNKLTESNFDSVSVDFLCSAVEDIRNNDQLSLVLTKALFKKAISENDLQSLLSEIWRKLLNIHPMAETLAKQMMEQCLLEYSKPRHKNSGAGAMKWIAELCKKKVPHSQDIVHKILSDMFVDDQDGRNVELWCKLIESLKNTVDTNKYFPQLNKLKKRFSAKIRFIIMDLEDLKKRNWVPRQ